MSTVDWNDSLRTCAAKFSLFQHLFALDGVFCHTQVNMLWEMQRYRKKNFNSGRVNRNY